MIGAQRPDPNPTGITTSQVVIGATVVLVTVLAFTLYSARDSAREEEPSASERARREVIESVIDACRRYDKPTETELDDACESLLGADNPL